MSEAQRQHHYILYSYPTHEGGITYQLTSETVITTKIKKKQRTTLAI